MAKKPTPLPHWFSETAHNEARKAQSEDEVFGAAYNEGARDEHRRIKQEQQAKKKPSKPRHASTRGMQGGQFDWILKGLKQGARAAKKR